MYEKEFSDILSFYSKRSSNFNGDIVIIDKSPENCFWKKIVRCMNMLR